MSGLRMASRTLSFAGALMMASAAQASLVAFYNFEESTTADIAGGSKIGAYNGQTFDFTQVGTVTQVNDGGAGNGSKAAQFDGLPNYLTTTLPANLFKETGTEFKSFTITMWVKLDAQEDDNSTQNLAHWGTTTAENSNGNIWVGEYWGGANNVVRVDKMGIDPLNSNPNPGGNMFGDGQWHFVALTVSNPGTGGQTTNTLYLDNLTATSKTMNLMNTTDSTFRLGWMSLEGPEFGLNGRLDNVAVFDHALSASEINAIRSGNYAAYINAVPEPASVALLALGGLLMARRRSRA